MKSEADYSQGCAWISGVFVPVEQAAIPILDFGFLRSDATYDVVHVWHGAFFRLEDHLDRFERNVDCLRMDLPMSRADIRNILSECVLRSSLEDAYVEMICTRGMPSKGTRDPRNCENQFFAFAIPFIPYANEEQKMRGIHIHVSKRQRIPQTSVDPTVKNFHWLDLQMSLFDAYEYGAENSVLTDHMDNVTEGPGFNIFCVTNTTVRTPGAGVLDGITRRTTLEICEEKNIDTLVGPVSVHDLMNADEAFITSTAGGIIPVTRVNDRVIGDGIPGKITKVVDKIYMEWHKDVRFCTPLEKS